MPANDSNAPPPPENPTPEEKVRKKAQALGNLAMNTLKAIMQGQGQDSVRLAAAREVLDRGHGRPKLGPAEGGQERLTVIVKRFSDVTAEDEAEADATEARS